MAKKTKKQDKPWTDKALAILDREFATCKSVTQLAKRLKRTPGALRQKAHARGLRRRPVKTRAKKAGPAGRVTAAIRSGLFYTKEKPAKRKRQTTPTTTEMAAKSRRKPKAITNDAPILPITE